MSFEERVLRSNTTSIWLFRFARAFGFALLTLTSLTASAAGGPSKLNVSGFLFTPAGLPVTNSSVNFKIEILDAAGTCVLYSENHLAENLSSSKGGFALEVGSGSSRTNNIDGSSPADLSTTVFKNPGAVAPFTGCAAGLTLNDGDSRVVRVYYDLGSGYTAMSPDVPVAASSYALVASTLEGKKASDFVQIRDDATFDLNQTNIESIFSAVNFTKLTAILGGSASNQKLTNVADPAAASDAATKGYADANVGGKIFDSTGVGPAAGDGKTLIWDQAQNKWVAGTPVITDATKLPLAGGTMTGAIDMGAQNITNSGHITMAALKTLNLGTYTDPQEATLVAGLTAADKGKIWFNTTSNAFKIWDGSAAVSSAPPSGAAGGDLTGTYPNPTVANDKITSAKINSTGVAVNRLLITDAATGASVGYANCAVGEVLKYGATGWTCSTAASLLGNSGVTAATYGSTTQVGQFAVDAQGRITSASNQAIAFPVISVAGKTGAVTLNTSDLTNAGTAATKDFGTAAGNLVELDGGGKIPVGVLPSSVGDIQDVVAGTGLTGGGSSGAVTLSVDTGTTTGKIVAMAASNKLPAVDGSNLTAINAVQMQGKNISGTAPTASQVLMWNNGTSVWEPQPVSAGGNFFAQNGNSFGANAVLGTSDNYSLAFKTNGATAMTIDTSGRVGVGTTIPETPLHVFGTAAWPATSGTTAKSHFRIAGSNSAMDFGLHTGVSWLQATDRTDQSINNKLLLNPNGGIVAIGTTSPPSSVGSFIVSSPTPASNLIAQAFLKSDETTGAANTGGRLAFGGSDGSATRFWSSITGYKENGTVGDLNGFLAFSTRSNSSMAEQMRITSAGNVGIGTTNPSSALQVAGTITATSFSGPISSSVVSAGTGTVGAPSLSFSGDSDTGFYNASSNNTISVAAGSANIFNFSSAGLVSPTTGGGLVTTANGTSGAPTFSFAGDPDTGWWRPAADTMAASTVGNERMRIDSSGNVGVGTASPTANFEVSGAANPRVRINTAGSTTNYSELLDAGAGQTVLNNVAAAASLVDINPVATDGTSSAWVRLGRTTNTSGSHGLQIMKGNNSATVDSQISANGGNSFFNLTAGNVGIGTSNPTELLDVNGTINYRGTTVTAMKFGGETTSSGAPSTDGYIVRYEPDLFTGTQDGIVFEKTDFNSNAPDGGILFANRGMDGIRQPALAIRGSGYIGIGTTAPTATLDVNGTIRPGSSATSCTSALAGLIRKNGMDLEVCQSGVWLILSRRGTGNQTIYVRTDGSDSLCDGSANASAASAPACAYLTPNKALNSIPDIVTGTVTVSIQSGTYYLDAAATNEDSALNVPVRQFNESGEIVIQSTSGTVTISGAKAAAPTTAFADWAVRVVGTQRVTLKNITATYSTMGGFLVQTATKVLLDTCAANNSAYGIYAYQNGKVQIQNGFTAASTLSNWSIISSESSTIALLSGTLAISGAYGIFAAYGSTFSSSSTSTISMSGAIIGGLRAAYNSTVINQATTTFTSSLSNSSATAIYAQHESSIIHSTNSFTVTYSGSGDWDYCILSQYNSSIVFSLSAGKTLTCSTAAVAGNQFANYTSIGGTIYISGAGNMSISANYEFDAYAATDGSVTLANTGTAPATPTMNAYNGSVISTAGSWTTNGTCDATSACP